MIQEIEPPRRKKHYIWWKYGEERGLPPLKRQAQTWHICHFGYPPLFHTATLPRLQVSIYPGIYEIPYTTVSFICRTMKCSHHSLARARAN